MMTVLALTALCFAALPAVIAGINLLLYRPLPSFDGKTAPVSVLIPARNEEKRIEPALRSVLASRHADLELLVLDDHSDDGTAAIVRRIAFEDERVRLLNGTPLPAGWSGKAHACQQLANAARFNILMFMDADVRLTPGALGRMAHCLKRGKAAMISGFPHERTEFFLEHLIIPLIHFLLLGFLPIVMMRWLRFSGFGAACGQLIMVRQAPYQEVGGHGAVRSSRHDGLTLPRAMRRRGNLTDLFDATDIACCRMYEGAEETWQGFVKNATEGMATPKALPFWTVTLFAGQVLPFLLISYGAITDLSDQAWRAAGAALLLSYGLRFVFAIRFSQSWLGASLHPLGVLVVLAIQWTALIRSWRGQSTAWRGRT